MRGFIIYHIIPILVSGTVLLSCSNNKYSPEIRQALAELDNTVSRKQEIEKELENRIAGMRSRLGSADSDCAKYAILDSLYSCYYQYDIDSAIFYARAKLELAETVNIATYHDAVLDLADRYALSGMYTEVFNIMEKLNPELLSADRKPTYYHIYNTVYKSLEYSSDDKILRERYREKKDRYREELLSLLGQDDISRIYVETEIKLENGDGEDIIGLVSVPSMKKVFSTTFLPTDISRPETARWLFTISPKVRFSTSRPLSKSTSPCMNFRRSCINTEMWTAHTDT